MLRSQVHRDLVGGQAYIGAENGSGLEADGIDWGWWLRFLIHFIAVLALLALIIMVVFVLVYSHDTRHKLSDTDQDVLQTKECACACVEIKQQMIGAGGYVIAESGCYVLAEDITFDGISLGAITIAGGVTATLDGRGHHVNLTSPYSFGVLVASESNVVITNMHVYKSSVSRGVSFYVLRNATATLEDCVCRGSGDCVIVRTRSSVNIRNLISDIRFDSADMFDFWGYGFSYAGGSIWIVDNANVQIDGATLRCIDTRNVLMRPPSIGADWLCLGIYVGLTSSEPVEEFAAVANASTVNIRNVAISGTSSPMILPYFDALSLSHITIECADGFADNCVQIGCDTPSGVVTLEDVNIDASALRPDSYNGYSWLIPMHVTGVRSFYAERLSIIGYGGQFYDPEGALFGTGVARRFPLLLLDTPAFCIQNTFFDCVGSDMLSAVVRDSMFTALGDDTVAIISGMGSGPGGQTSVDLENVHTKGGAIGVLIGPYTKTARINGLRAEGSYYGLIVANGTTGLIAKNMDIQDTCIPYWVQTNAQYNLLKDSECTVNGDNGWNDNSVDNTVAGSVNDRFVQYNCGAAPELFELPDFVAYNEMVFGAAITGDTSNRVPASAQLFRTLLPDFSAIAAQAQALADAATLAAATITSNTTASA